MDKNSKIEVLGANGLVGSAIVRNLKAQGYTNVLATTRKDVDLIDPLAVENHFRVTRPEYVFLAAAKVGGIHANNVFSADFIYENLTIQTNVIKACHENDVKKLMFLGSVCIYPKYAAVPVKEESLLTGDLEPTNEAYAIAEVTGYKGHIAWDCSKPNGTPKRMLDSTRLFNLGWRPKVNLKEGLTKAVNWYKLHRHEIN